MSSETVKEKEEYMLDNYEELQKMKFNIISARKSLTLKNSLLIFTMEHKFN